MLGALEVSDGDRLVPLGGPKQRVVLAHLLLNANRVVTVERLIDALWGSAPPETARNTLQTYIKHLRKRIGAQRIEHVSSGYLLRAEAQEVDLLRFDALVEEARQVGTTDRAAAATTLRQALDLWRGSALDDLNDHRSLQPHIARLDEARIGAIEGRIAAELESGRHQELAAELETLLAHQPYRERSWGFLMVALYRSGRQGDALAAFGRAQRILADELGIDPTTELQRLHEQILRQDPALELAGEPLRGYRSPEVTGDDAHGATDRDSQPEAGGVAVGVIHPRPANAPEDTDHVERLRPLGPSRSGGRRPSRRWTVGVGAVVLLALLAGSIALVGSGHRARLDVGTDSVARFDMEDGDFGFATELGQRPGASAVGFGSLWVAQPDQGMVARLDLEDGSITNTIRVGNSPSGVAIGEGSVWVTNTGDGTVSRINVQTDEVSQVLRAGSGPAGIAFGDGALWIADSTGGALLRVDPGSEEIDSVPLAGLPSGVDSTSGAVWVSIAPNSVARIDPRRPAVVFTQTVGNRPTAIVDAFGSIWVANHLDGTVTRLDPSTGREVATIPVGEGPNALVAAGGSLWIANEFDDTVVAIDPETNIVERTVQVGGAVASLATDRDGIWLAVGAGAAEHRGGTLTISGGDGVLNSLDPAVVYDPEGWRILTITNDGLLAYKKVGGPDGATLVPDLASALPEVSPDGLTYRFPLRQRIRYSNGNPVRPEDFRRAIERALVLHDGAGLLNAIAGADSCVPRHPEACDLSDSIDANEEAVTFHLTTPDPDLPFKLAMPFAFPVPAETPAIDQGLDPLPATGPYMVEHARRRGIELVRNPRFEEWSAAAQPDGFVDAISWRFGWGPGAEFDRLETGDLDVMIDTPLPGDLAALRSAHPDRIVAWPDLWASYVGFDVRKPPFDDVRVRQALNYAIARDHVAELLGDTTTQRPTCQILPPNFQGYVPFCPYTLEPESGVWSEPDLEHANVLIDEAGVVGKKVTVWAVRGSPGSVSTMRYVTNLLDDLGLRADLRIVPLEEYIGTVFPPAPAGTAAHPNVYLTSWRSDYAAAGNFLAPLFTCGEEGFANTSGWCDRALDDQMDEALLLSATDPGAANRAWANIEHRLVEAAAIAPLTNPVTTHAVSARVENVQVNPQWGLLLSRLWIE